MGFLLKIVIKAEDKVTAESMQKIISTVDISLRFLIYHLQLQPQAALPTYLFQK